MVSIIKKMKKEDQTVGHPYKHLAYITNELYKVVKIDRCISFINENSAGKTTKSNLMSYSKQRTKRSMIFPEAEHNLYSHQPKKYIFQTI